MRQYFFGELLPHVDPMLAEQATPLEAAFERWIPIARQVVRRTLNLRWSDVFEIYTYILTIPLAEALALEARRAGSDTHLTLMTDDLWFMSMRELPTRWLRAASPAETAINKAITASVYLGGPADARRFRDIPPEKFEANAMGNDRQDEPLHRRRVRQVDLSIGRVTPGRAEAYGLDYARWRRSYEAALGVDLRDIRRVGTRVSRAVSGRKEIRIESDAGTALTFRTKAVPPIVDDGVISPADVRRGSIETALPAGSMRAAADPSSAEGEVHFADPVFLFGRTVRGLRMTFRKGKLLAWGADENVDIAGRALKDLRGGRDRLTWFTIGLNPAAEPCMLDNTIVQNDVGIGLGVHPEFERGRATAGPQFHATIGPSRITVDGSRVSVPR